MRGSTTNSAGKSPNRNAEGQRLRGVFLVAGFKPPLPCSRHQGVSQRVRSGRSKGSVDSGACAPRMSVSRGLLLCNADLAFWALGAELDSHFANDYRGGIPHPPSHAGRPRKRWKRRSLRFSPGVVGCGTSAQRLAAEHLASAQQAYLVRVHGRAKEVKRCTDQSRTSRGWSDAQALPSKLLDNH
jgi:hypothetical protein